MTSLLLDKGPRVVTQLIIYGKETLKGKGFLNICIVFIYIVSLSKWVWLSISVKWTKKFPTIAEIIRITILNFYHHAQSWIKPCLFHHAYNVICIVSSFFCFGFPLLSFLMGSNSCSIRTKTVRTCLTREVLLWLSMFICWLVCFYKTNNMRRILNYFPELERLVSFFVGYILK